MANTFTLPGGIYPPLPTFFDTQDELDLATFRLHIKNLSETGMAGYVVMGTNGEAVHLTTDERTQLIEAVRNATGENVPILAGCGEQSTRGTVANCHLAARAGASAALVLPPFYFKSRMDSFALQAHYRSVADASPLPVVIYNMPGSTGGLDLDAATIIALTEHPNIIGVKDSSGNIAKLAQIVDKAPSHFRVFAGNAGFLLPALSVGAVGAVTALANIFPRQVCQLQALFEAGQREAARRLQARLIPANNAVTTIYSVPGLKAALELTAGYGGRPRSPLQPLSEAERGHLAQILQTIE